MEDRMTVVVRLTPEQAKQRAVFVASLDAAEREAEEKGCLDIVDVIAALDADDRKAGGQHGGSSGLEIHRRNVKV
jgi:hypothetical protein